MQWRSNSERLPLNNEERTGLITYWDFNGIGHDGFIRGDGTSREGYHRLRAPKIRVDVVGENVRLGSPAIIRAGLVNTRSSSADRWLLLLI